MPIVNIYAEKSSHEKIVADQLLIRQKVSQELAAPELLIDESHISLRVIEAAGYKMGDIEFEIFAHEFPVRVINQDNISAGLRDFFEKLWGKDVRVWLILSQLGYGKKRSQK